MVSSSFGLESGFFVRRFWVGSPLRGLAGGGVTCQSPVINSALSLGRSPRRTRTLPRPRPASRRHRKKAPSRTRRPSARPVPRPSRSAAILVCCVSVDERPCYFDTLYHQPIFPEPGPSPGINLNYSLVCPGRPHRPPPRPPPHHPPLSTPPGTPYFSLFHGRTGNGNN